MKLIRLPSGPLACVYSVEAEADQGTQSTPSSGVFRAFSGSVEVDAVSEDQAIQALDEEVRRLSVPPPADITQFELSREVANDVTRNEGPGIVDATGRHARYSELDTQPAPAPVSSSRR